MKSSARPLLLIPGHGMLNKKRRYFNMRNALKKAVEYTVDMKDGSVIYDTERGVDIVTVHPKRGEIVAIIHSPRIFNKHWSD